MPHDPPTLDDFGFNSQELMVELQRETMGKLIAAEKEIGRLRTALRVNGLRWGFSDAEIDAIIYQSV